MPGPREKRQTTQCVVVHPHRVGHPASDLKLLKLTRATATSTKHREPCAGGIVEANLGILAKRDRELAARADPNGAQQGEVFAGRVEAYLGDESCIGNRRLRVSNRDASREHSNEDRDNSETRGSDAYWHCVSRTWIK